MLLLLLLLGTSIAYPQYGPPIHEEPAPEPEPQDIFPTQQIQDGGGLTQDFEEKPKFWWLNSGIFSGTDKEASAHSEPGEGVGGPFTPHQSKFCDTGFDCVPFGLCHEGLITPLGEGVLQQRSKPANFDDLQCGQPGNICCGIPEDILTAQRENVEGIEVIEDVYVEKTPDVGEISQAPVIEVVKIPIEEVPDLIVEENPYVEEDPDTKQESPPSSPLAPDILPIVPDVDGTYDPSPVAVLEGEEVVESDPSATRIEGQDSLGYAEVDFCGHVSYKCVPYFLCKDGVIVTDGAGLIDVRIRPQGVCTHPEYPDVPGVCCLKPGSDPTPSPLEQCPDYQECVEYNLCTASGTIDTEGGGGLNLRTGRQNCYLSSGANGVCCSPPPPIPEVVQFCPENSECMLENQCTGQALDGSKVFVDYHSSGSWASCTLGNIYGICCIRSIPVIRETCPENSACVLKDQCSGQALDESSNFVDYIQSGTWSYCSSEYGQGVCCRSLPPKVIGTCPGESVCLKPDLCKGDALDASDKFVEYSSPGEWSHCSQHVGGVCCINPVTDSYLQPASSCGIRNYKIDERITSTPYGGNEASFGEFPWQAIIFFQNYTYVCGASLVSNKHLVTAAHCVDGYQAGDIKIRFGEWQVVSTDEALPYVDINVHKIYIHPQFNPKNVHKDIAVLELYEPVDYQYHINSVCLPPQGAVIEPYTKCFTTGWGKDSFEGTFQHILKKIELPYLDHQTCQDLLRKTRLGKYFRLDSSFVCAGGEENKDACFGDGGGPLVYKDKVTSQYTLVGITSWGIGCGTINVPGVYVNVPAFADWINEIILGQYQEPKEQVSEDHLKDAHLQQPGEGESLGQPQLHHEPGHVEDPIEQPHQPHSQDPEPDVSQPSESKPVDHQPYEEQPHPPKPEDVPPSEVPHDAHPEIIPAVEVPHDPQPEDHHSQPHPDDQQTHEEQQQQQIPEEEQLPIPGYGK